MTDIVEQLRHPAFTDGIRKQAADEIERLRIENGALKERLRNASPNPTMDWALNSGDGTYRP